MLLLLFISSLLIFSVLSHTSCKYGQFERVNGTCKFNCEYDSILYKEISELTFNQIKESCAGLQQIAKANPSTCTSVDDLVWPTGDINCGECPFCKCDTVNTEGEVFETTTYFGKECSSCTCAVPWSQYGITEPVYECGQIGYFGGDNIPSEWDLWQCPTLKCKVDDSYFPTRNAGSVWFKEQENSDDKCEELCTCNTDETVDCLTGWTNIFDNDAFAEYMHYQCGGSLADCLDEPSRMFTTETGPYCWLGGCPKCDCGQHSLGDSWFTEFTNPWSGEDICVECRCLMDSYGNAYSSCFRDAYYNYAIGKECIESTINEITINCHEDFRHTIDGEEFSGIVSELTSETCYFSYYGDTAPSETIAYCSWNYEERDNGKEKLYSWGCEDGSLPFICEAYGVEGGCIYYNTSAIVDDCHGNSQEVESISGYQYCCSGDNCNYENIDISNCQRSTEYEDLLKELDECLFDFSDPIIASKWCGEPLEEGEDITCDGIERLYKQQYACYCKVYSVIYNAVGDASKKRVQAAINRKISTAAQYNSVFGCNIHLICDLEGIGQIYNRDDAQRDGVERYDMFGAIVAVFAAFVMYYA